MWGQLGVWHSGGSQAHNKDVESAKHIWSLARKNTHDTHIDENGDQSIHAEKCRKKGDGDGTEENMGEEERERLDSEKKADWDLILPWQGRVEICEEMLLCHNLGDGDVADDDSRDLEEADNWFLRQTHGQKNKQH